MRKNKVPNKGKPFDKKSRQGNSKADKITPNRKEVVKDFLSSLNDIAWYARNPELLSSVGRLAFPYRPGMKLQTGPFRVGSTSISESASTAYNIPGVCGIKFAYSIGYSDSVTSPASIAAKEMWSRIRSKFSSDLTADPPDIMMYALALDQIHAYIAYLKRIYRILNAWDPNNRALPDTLLVALGITASEASELRTKKTEFWGKINTLVLMANKFSLPDDMKLYERHRWMNENVYTDAPTVASQMYIFVPRMFWVVNDTTETGTSLDVSMVPTTHTVDAYYNYGLNLIDKLSTWEDAYTINGYIERAFDGTNFLKSELLEENSLISFAYVPTVLSQIENSFSPLNGTAGDTVIINTMTVTQDPSTNTIIHTPTVGSARYSGPVNNWIINLHNDNPSIEDTVEATRLTATVDSTVASNHPIYCGTELVLSYDYYAGATSATCNSVLNMSNSSVLSMMIWIRNRMAYSYAPILYMAQTGDNPVVQPVCEVANMTLASRPFLDELHRVCIYSLFNCFRRE